jgi:hypothetical protein
LQSQNQSSNIWISLLIQPVIFSTGIVFLTYYIQNENGKNHMKKKSAVTVGFDFFEASAGYIGNRSSLEKSAPVSSKLQPNSERDWQ